MEPSRGTTGPTEEQPVALNETVRGVARELRLAAGVGPDPAGGIIFLNGYSVAPRRAPGPAPPSLPNGRNRYGEQGRSGRRRKLRPGCAIHTVTGQKNPVRNRTRSRT